MLNSQRRATQFTFVSYTSILAPSAEQRQALRKLFSSGFGPGQPAEAKEVAIKFENLDVFGQVGKTVTGTDGEIGKVELPPSPVVATRTSRWRLRMRLTRLDVDGLGQG